ncbi:hypothetical protein ACFPYI_13750 [Halomarina salina]|uniref:ATP-binding protein n=1 Tax=Halomarina salina TaxID=1872699 RepID=A0ABD5RQD0_9EURY|nr:hypothetical protein [Halomarina salina]
MVLPRMREVRTVSNDGLAESYLREWLNRERERDDGIAPPPWVAEIDDPVARKAMAMMAQSFDPVESSEQVSSFEETELFERAYEFSGGESLYDDVRNGNVGRSSYRKGRGGSESIDASSWGAAEVLTEKLWRPSDDDHMLNLMVYGPAPSIAKGSNTGKGKTDFSYTAIDGGIRAYAAVGKTLQACTNNTTDTFPTVKTWSEALEWMQETDGPKVLMLDEAAQGLKFQDMTAGDVLSLAMRLMRKYQCHLILIAHTGKDIPKDVRRSVVFARKDTKTRVTLGNKLDEDSSGDMQIRNVEYELRNLPPTNLAYSSMDDEGEFTWDIDDDDSGETEGLGEEDGDFPECEAINSSNNEPCEKEAMYPRGDPTYCGTHRSRL